MIILVIGLSFLSCTKKIIVPDCSDDKTKEIFLKKYGSSFVYTGLLKQSGHEPNKKEIEMIWDIFIFNERDKFKKIPNEEFIEYVIKAFEELKYADGTLESLDNVRFELKNIREVSYDEDIGRYKCSADLYLIIPDKEPLKPKEITYASEVADGGKKHYVTSESYL